MQHMVTDGVFSKMEEPARKVRKANPTQRNNADYFMTQYMNTMLEIQQKQLEFTVWTNWHAKGDLFSYDYKSLGATDEPAGTWGSLGATDEPSGAWGSLGATDEPSGDNLRRATEAELESKQVALIHLIGLAKKLKESYEQVLSTA